MINKLFEKMGFLALAVMLMTPAMAAQRQVLKGHLVKEVANLSLQPMGRLSATQRLSLVIGLSLRNSEAVSNVLGQLYNPQSWHYHHWLTPQQIAQRFGPTEEDYQKVISYVKKNGLNVVSTHADRTLLRVEGSVADIEKMLGVTMREYQHPTEARVFYAPDAEPTADLAVPLLHISGLNNFNIPHSGSIPQTSSLTRPGITGGTGPGETFWGKDFRSAYVPGSFLTGTGQAVGLLELDGYYASDVAAYEESNDLPNVKLVNVPVDGFDGLPDANSNDIFEVTLDIDMAISMAPGLSEVIVYENVNSGNQTDSLDILKRMQEDNIAKQLSSSFFIYDDPNEDTIYLQFAMQGQSFFQCSGDFGAFYNGITEWADNPYITLVGGTALGTKSKGGPWASEQTWDATFPLPPFPPPHGSGGGVSASYLGDYSIPEWQQGVNMSFNGGSTAMRNVPDVAMVAQGVWVMAFNGQTSVLSGTSVAAPLWAAFTALVNEQASANSEPTVGFLNPALYAIGQGPNYTSCFHDIVVGNNTNYGNATGYFAQTGYDLCTGWGSPNGTNLINALMPYTGATWVDFNYTGSTQNGSYTTPFSTLTAGVSAVLENGNVWIKTAGVSSETLTISKPLNIRAANGAASIGN